MEKILKYNNKETTNNNNKNDVLYKSMISFLFIFYFIFLLFFVNKKIILKNNAQFYVQKAPNKNTINYKIKLLKLITNNNELLYKGAKNCLLNDPDSQLCFYHLIFSRKVVGKQRILLGKKFDGSYVLVDDFTNIKVAYSFGISTTVHFDLELAKKNIDVYMYDHTIKNLPENHPKFHWKKKGICGKTEKNENLNTLEDYIIENGHSSEKNMILKIDVEHYEWNVLNDLKDEILYQFKYILIEFHFTNMEKEEQLYYNVLKKLNKSHQVIYFRCNLRETIVNYRNNRLCKFLELSYIIREGNKFEKDDSIYPIFDFDYMGPTDDGKEEMNLNILNLFDFNE